MSQASTTGAAADEALARMGYKSELPRNLSMLSVLGLSVSERESALLLMAR